jgi:hypothetical protein
VRALAHPLRWKLIDLIEAEDAATATRCAEVTGESVASCSYHLGVLAKYGYLEPAPSTSRERPWQLTSREQVISSTNDSSVTTVGATKAADTFLDHEFARLRDRRRTLSSEPKRWREASLIGGSTLWVTLHDLAAIKREILELFHRYDERAEPSNRPDGVRLARVFAASTVMPDPPPKK